MGNQFYPNGGISRDLIGIGYYGISSINIFAGIYGAFMMSRRLYRLTLSSELDLYCHFELNEFRAIMHCQLILMIVFDY